MVVYGLARALALPLPIAAAGDAFFFSYLLLIAILALRLTPQDLDRRADQEDEGIVVLSLITVAAVAYSCIAIFTLLNQKHPVGMLPLALAVAGAPLGWLTFHTIGAFHYAYIYYRGTLSEDVDRRALRFPGAAEEQPGPWDFVYFSFVIGMTAQVSDVLVQTTRMRRAVAAHGVASFVFNTVLIAMAVNAAVANVQG